MDDVFFNFISSGLSGLRFQNHEILRGNFPDFILHNRTTASVPIHTLNHFKSTST